MHAEPAAGRLHLALAAAHHDPVAVAGRAAQQRVAHGAAHQVAAARRGRLGGAAHSLGLLSGSSATPGVGQARIASRTASTARIRG